MANSHSSPSQLLSQLEGVSHQSFNDEASRIQALVQARALVRRLETPVDTGMRIMWMETATNIALKSCHDLGIFTQLVSGPKSTEELAKACGAEPELLHRLLRHLAAGLYLKEEGIDKWAATEISNAFAKDMGCIIDFWDGIMLPASSAVPAFLKDSGWKNPIDRNNSAWQRGHKTKLPFFDELEAHPAKHKVFNETMRSMQINRTAWFEVYPARERLISRFDPSISDILLIDVGGGIGHDVESFRQAFPDHKGALMLQDLDSVVADARVDSSIKVQAHSFFNPEPVTAAAYYMGSILHDWPDPEASQILANLAQAMKPGYSRVILREPILPETGVGLMATTMDITMLTVLASKERTRKDWDKLAASAGLKVSKTWIPAGAPRHILELVLEGDSV